MRFLPNDTNVFLSGGWCKAIMINDIRVGYPVGHIFGPIISGDALDVHDDMVVGGNYSNKDCV